MPDFHMLVVSEHPNFRLIVSVPHDLTADQAAHPEDHPELDPDFDPNDYLPEDPDAPGRL